MSEPLGTHAEFDALADRLTGRGMTALKTADWPLLVVALEEAVERRKPPPAPAPPTLVADPSDRDVDLAFFTGCSCRQCVETRNEGRRRGVLLSGEDKLREADASRAHNVIPMTDEERSGVEKVAQWLDQCNWKTEARNVRCAAGLPQKYGPAPDYRPMPA